jgi:lipopolysaccharide/colanic/teichoic acid biosynthesis glycosyltransferase
MQSDWTILNRPLVFPYRKTYQIAKRVMDLTICILVLPLALPLMGILALLVRLDSPGPALFIQERVGLGGKRRFRMYKFRTLLHDLDDSYHRSFMKAFVNGEIGDNGANGNGTNGTNGTNGKNGHPRDYFFKAFPHPEPGNNGNGKVYKPIQASQITRVGRILRKTSLDELPQIFNVLKGEMSLVGPRPNVPWEVDEYRGWHNERLEVLPGITGLAQVRGRSASNFKTIVDHDIEYIENQSLVLDLKTLWWTVEAVISGNGSS